MNDHNEQKLSVTKQTSSHNVYVLKLQLEGP